MKIIIRFVKALQNNAAASPQLRLRVPLRFKAARSVIWVHELDERASERSPSRE